MVIRASNCCENSHETWKKLLKEVYGNVHVFFSGLNVFKMAEKT